MHWNMCATWGHSSQSYSNRRYPFYHCGSGMGSKCLSACYARCAYHTQCTSLSSKTLYHSSGLGRSHSFVHAGGKTTLDDRASNGPHCRWNVTGRKALFRRLKSSLIEGRSSTGKHRGRWFHPFWETLSIARIACDYHAPFVQWVSHDPRPTMHILAKWRDHPVVFWEKQFFYTVFSPELSGDYRIHEYFLRYLLMNRSRHG